MLLPRKRAYRTTHNGYPHLIRRFPRRVEFGGQALATDAVDVCGDVYDKNGQGKFSPHVGSGVVPGNRFRVNLVTLAPSSEPPLNV